MPAKLIKEIWCEDDACPHDSEKVHQAWKRMFGEDFSVKNAVDIEHDDDGTFYHMANGHSVFSSWPGNSAIYRSLVSL